MLSSETFKALNTLHGFWLSQMNDWHRETIVTNQKSLHDASLLSGTAENHAVLLGLKF